MIVTRIVPIRLQPPDATTPYGPLKPSCPACLESVAGTDLYCAACGAPINADTIPLKTNARPLTASTITHAIITAPPDDFAKRPFYREPCITRPAIETSRGGAGLRRDSSVVCGHLTVVAR